MYNYIYFFVLLLQKKCYLCVVKFDELHMRDKAVKATPKHKSDKAVALI